MLGRVATVASACGLFALLAHFGPAAGACSAVPGDIDGNSAVDVTDVQCALLATLAELAPESSSPPDCLGGALSAADTDCDGAAGVADVLLVIQRVLDLDWASSVDSDGDGCADACQAACTPTVVGGEPLPDGFFGAGCALPPDPTTPGELELVPAFPGLPPFDQPLYLTHAGDGSNRLFVIEQTGRIRVFVNEADVEATTVFADLSAQVVATDGEGGVLGLAFHPAYADNGQLFVTTLGLDPLTSEQVLVLSRFSVSASDPNAVDMASQEILLTIEQPFNNHNGGWIGFGPDGYLYVATGDGGAACGITGDAEDPMTLRGSILRLDVDAAADGAPYGIPPDNPWAGGPTPDGVAAAPETWAYGFRNPWRASFDAVTGLLWLGDVGQGAIEEVDVVAAGADYGWPEREGSLCQPESGTCVGLVPPCTEALYAEPVAEYGHSVGRSITGGYVYRGAALPSLQGHYVYGDFVTSAVFLWDYTAEAAPESPTLFSPQSVASFGLDESSELYLVGYQGAIYRFQEIGEVAESEDFPQTLSETGCFSDVSALAPGAGLIPYRPIAELYSDGARKARWVAVPSAGAVEYDADDEWHFPPGTTFLKHFEIDLVEGDPTTTTRLETRLLAVDADGVRGYTYRWNDEGTEAYLLSGAETRELALVPSVGDPVDITWQFPSRAQCRSCHTPASGGVLGLSTRQLNAGMDYGAEQGCPTTEPAMSAEINQITAWSEWGLFAAAPDEAPEELPAFVDPHDPAAPAEARARAYLHTNCAHCHQPGSATGTGLDLRGATSLAEMGAVLEPAQKALTGADLSVIEPGEPALSELYLRLTASFPQRMPPLGTTLVPSGPTDAVFEWISTLVPVLACPPNGFTGQPNGHGPAWGSAEGVDFHTVASEAAVYQSWAGVDWVERDMWLAVRWPGADLAPDAVGGVLPASADAGWAAVYHQSGPGDLCVWLAADVASGCVPVTGVEHYSGGAGFAFSSAKIPWTVLGAETVPESAEFASWVTDESGGFVEVLVPGDGAPGSAPALLEQWYAAPVPGCAP